MRRLTQKDRDLANIIANIRSIENKMKRLETRLVLLDESINGKHTIEKGIVAGSESQHIFVDGEMKYKGFIMEYEDYFALFDYHGFVCRFSEFSEWKGLYVERMTVLHTITTTDLEKLYDKHTELFAKYDKLKA